MAKKKQVPMFVPTMQEFLGSRAVSCAESTVKLDRTALARFSDFIQAKFGEDIPLEDVTKPLILAHFDRQSLGPEAFNARRRTFRVFFEWCLDRDLITGSSPARVIKSRKVPEVERLMLPPHEFPALLDAAKNPRDRAIMAIGLGLMLRQGEIGPLRVKDVDIRARRIKATIRKTGAFDRMPTSRVLMEEMDRWYQWYARNLGVSELDPNWYLVPPLLASPFAGRAKGGAFLQGENRPNPTAMLPNTYFATKHALGVLGYATERNGGHVLRRSSARAMHDYLVSIGEPAMRPVMAMLHHKQQETTERYLGLREDVMNRDRLVEGQDIWETSNVVTFRSRRAGGERA